MNVKKKKTHISGNVHLITQGIILARDGVEIINGVWESCVYLGQDEYVYYLAADLHKGAPRVTILGKRTIGEYLRWVDGIFNPGELPREANAIHYRAARYLRELL